MNLYLVTQKKNRDYDTFDAFVVASESAEQAVLYHPGGDWFEKPVVYPEEPWGKGYSSWCPDPSYAKAKLIGVTDEYEEGTQIIASFNAG